MEDETPQDCKSNTILIAKDYPINYLRTDFLDSTIIRIPRPGLESSLCATLKPDGVEVELSFTNEQLTHRGAISIEYFRDTSLHIPFTWSPIEEQHRNLQLVHTLDEYVINIIYSEPDITNYDLARNQTNMQNNLQHTVSRGLDPYYYMKWNHPSQESSDSDS